MSEEIYRRSKTKLRSKNTRKDTEKDQAQSSNTVKPIAKAAARLRGKSGGVNIKEDQSLRVFSRQSNLSSFENS